MNKDVIYIDAQDDITTIIGKIKASKERIIALVPPRQIGVLRSAVNIRLLAKAAHEADKRIVLITGDAVLSGLAATVKIPIAKTLQSKPEIAEIPALKIDDDDDIIDGEAVSAGKDDAPDEHKAGGTASSDIDGGVDREEETKPTPKSSSKAKTPKVPNFNIFRKKLVLIGGGVLLLVAFLVWAIWFAPHATVVISAKTTDVTVGEVVGLSPTATTDAKSNVIRSTKKDTSKEVSVEFAATGKKNIGEKATGSVIFSNSSKNSITITSGTIVQTSGLSYRLSSSVTVPAASLGWDCPNRTCNGSASGTIVAAEGGSQYNTASGSVSLSVDGVSARLKSPTSGGTDKTATVVTAGDIASAKSRLDEQKVSGLKEQLVSSFGNSAKVIDASYTENRSNPSSGVSVGAEANGNVTLKAAVVASMEAVETDELRTFVEEKIRQEIAGKASQKIYDTGTDKVKFTQYVAGAPSRVRVAVNGKVGPEINESKVKDQAKGHAYGEIQSSIEAIDGVEDVDVKFSPFWVRSAPNDTSKIKVEFKLKDVK